MVILLLLCNEHSASGVASFIPDRTFGGTFSHNALSDKLELLILYGNATQTKSSHFINLYTVVINLAVAVESTSLAPPTRDISWC